MIRADTDFIFGTHHAETFHAADFTNLYFLLKQRNISTDLRQNTDQANLDVRRAADNLSYRRTVIDFQDMKMIGIRMGCHLFDSGGNKTIHVFKRINNLLNLQTDFSQRFRNLLNAGFCLQMFFQPG